MELTVHQVIKWHEDKADEAWERKEESLWLFHIQASAKLAVKYVIYSTSEGEK